jgi:nickel-dependent lactate racemase
MPALADPVATLRASLAAPAGARPLAEEARGARSACVLVCDLTRPVPNGILLPPILRALLEGGIPAERIRILVATGLHRPNLGAELEEILGDPWITRTFAVENHDARDDAAHVDLGPTAAGTPAKIDRRFVEAELKIVTGLVEPHFMAGYSGGRKVIAPGVAHRDTITTFHSARFMAHPRAVSCVLDGNPLHEEQLAIAAKLGPVRAANVVIDERRRISFVSYGALVESHLAAVAFVERFAIVPLQRRFRTVVTSAAGHPLDRTYYQTVKGMVGPLEILEPGGRLVIASSCADGMGSKEYVAAQRRLVDLGPDGFWRGIAQKRFADVDEWQTQMQLKPMRLGRIQLYAPALSAGDRALTGVESIDSVEEAVLDAVRTSGDRAVAVVPEGPYVVPVYRPTAS